MTNDSKEPPSGYDVPPDLSAAPVPSGYDAPPDLAESKAAPAIPVPSGNTVPDLGEAGDAQAVDSLQEAVESQVIDAPGGFHLKPMGQEYIDREKNAPSQTVEISGAQVEVHEKEWLRDKYNEQQEAAGGETADLEKWRANKVATTQYMNEERAADHQVSFEKGVDANEQENASLQGPSVEPGKDHIFVMDEKGEIFAKGTDNAHLEQDSTGRQAHVHHSSFKAGEAVAGAGELRVDDEGFLKEVTDRSGHYRPGEEQTAQTMEHLEQAKGVNLDNTKFTMDRGDAEEDKTRGMAREYLQGKMTPEEKAHRNQKLADGGELKTEVGSAMEKTFQGRHGVADEVKSKLESVRETLDQDADRRAARVELADEHLSKGTDYGKVSRAVGRSAEKAEAKLEQKVPSVRESLGSSLGNRQSQPSQGARAK